VPDEEIVRGYEVDGEWVTVEAAELDAAAPILTRSIEVRDFVDAHEIDPIHFQRPYYLGPGEGGEEQFVVLREAIRRSGKVGVVEFVLLRRQHLAVLRPHGEALLLETLYYPEELIDERELALPATTRLREGEIRLATEVIELRSRRPFDLSDYQDEYRLRILDLIREKAAGRIPEGAALPAAPEPTPIIDLTRRLRESLEVVRREEGGRAA
jgi:DNA end-binding protein Ku